MPPKQEKKTKPKPARQMNPKGVHSAHHPNRGDLRAKVDSPKRRSVTKKKTVTKKPKRKSTPSKRLTPSVINLLGETRLTTRGGGCNCNGKCVCKAKHLQHGGMSFINDIVTSGKDLINGNQQVFTSIKNLGVDIFCETNAVKNLPKELDLGYDSKCKYTKTKSWNPKMFEGR